MTKITLKITAFLLLVLFTLQVQAQPCPELWNEEGIYKISTCGVGGDAASELYMTINGTTADLEWAALLPGDDPTQLWRVIDHRTPASAGYVEIWATIPGVGDFTMAVDQSSFTPGGSDPEIRLTVVPGQPIGDISDPNYEYDQFQRRKATGWTGAGNNALFAKPPGQGNLRYGVIPASAGEQVLFQNGGAIDPIRFIFVSTLSTEAFDESSIFIANPVKEKLSIKGLTQNINSVAVYSLVGQEVISKKLNGEPTLSLDISTLTKGVYIVDFKGENGSLTKKIVKQ